MATWWDILGVEQAADLRAVKRAYAAKLKTIRQDENPKEFMVLRAAYDAGRAAIAQREIRCEEQFGSQDWHMVKVTDLQSRDGKPQDSIEYWDTEPSSQPHIPGPVELLMDAVDKLMKSPWGAGSIASWQNILDDERLDDIDVYGDFEHALLNYFLNIHGFFNDDENISPKINLDVAHFLFTHFGWRQKRNTVNIDPAVYDWLAAKFLQPKRGPVYGQARTDEGLAERVFEAQAQANASRGFWYHLDVIILGLIAAFIVVVITLVSFF